MLGAFSKRANSIVSSTQSLPSPVGGWNVRDSIANMAEEDAVIMDNWFPTPSDIMVRKGQTSFATGLGSQVESLMFFNSKTGTNKLYAAAGSNIYEVTNGGAVGTASVTALSNSRFQFVNFNNAAGTTYLYAVNGTDAPLLYDGSSWTNPAITGFTASSAININVFKERIWLVQKDTMKAWYLNTGAIQGTAAAVDLSGFAYKGGYLMAMGTWTLDAGKGVDDYAVFITSKGQAIVFEGTDPTSSSTWNMRGVWDLGEPIGRRCFLKFGGDLLLICVDGVVPMSKALISSRVNPRIALTDKIQGAMQVAGSNYSDNFGWELCGFDTETMLILNVPVQEGQSQEQYAMNTITGSWCRFTDVEANCWVIYDDRAYFGGNGFVGRFWDGYEDLGDNISAECLQAFSYFKERGRLKHFKEARPILSSNGTPSILAVLEVDFQTQSTTGALIFSPTTYGVWGADLTILRNWQTLANIGTSAAVHFYVAQKGIETRWLATDFLFERGGVI